MVPAHALLGVEDEYWRAKTGGYDDIALYGAVADVASDPSQQLTSLPEEKSGDVFSCLAGRTFRQVPYMARSCHHQVIMLCHGERLGRTRRRPALPATAWRLRRCFPFGRFIRSPLGYGRACQHSVVGQRDRPGCPGACLSVILDGHIVQSAWQTPTCCT